MRMETVDINLANTVFAQVELSQLPQFFEMLDFDNLIIGSMEDFQLLKRAVLQTIEVLQLVAGYV